MMPDPRREAIEAVLRCHMSQGQIDTWEECGKWERFINALLALLPPVPERAELLKILGQQLTTGFLEDVPRAWIDNLLASAGQGSSPLIWCEHMQYSETLKGWELKGGCGFDYRHEWTACPICAALRPGHEQP